MKRHNEFAKNLKKTFLEVLFVILKNKLTLVNWKISELSWSGEQKNLELTYEGITPKTSHLDRQFQQLTKTKLS